MGFYRYDLSREGVVPEPCKNIQRHRRRGLSKSAPVSYEDLTCNCEFYSLGQLDIMQKEILVRKNRELDESPKSTYDIEKCRFIMSTAVGTDAICSELAAFALLVESTLVRDGHLFDSTCTPVK